MKTKENLIFTWEEIKHVYSLGKLEGLFSPFLKPNARIKDVNFNRFIEEKLIFSNIIETVNTEM